MSKSSIQQEASKENKSEKDEKSEDDSKPAESAVELDVFQAISLVNSQLRWKDFHAENSRSSRLLLSSKHLKAEVRESNEQTELFNGYEVAILAPFTNNWIVFAYPTEIAATSSVERSLTVQENTIAFILNCGTYPTPLS